MVVSKPGKLRLDLREPRLTNSFVALPQQSSASRRNCGYRVLRCFFVINDLIDVVEEEVRELIVIGFKNCGRTRHCVSEDR
jgi:hypothetical protein